MRALPVDGVDATEGNVEDGSYPISRELYVFTNGDPRGDAYDYISYLLSDGMEQVIRDAGYIPAYDSIPGGKEDAE